MRILITSLIIVLATWMGGGTYFWVCKVKKICKTKAGLTAISPSSASLSARAEKDSLSEGTESLAKAVSVPASTSSYDPFVLRYQDRAVMAFAENLHFRRTRPTAFIPAVINQSLDSLAAVLTTHKDKTLEVTGNYAVEEKNRSGSANLGLARAGFFAQQLLQRGISESRIIKSFQLMSLNQLINDRDSLKNGISLRLLDPLTKGSGADTGVDLGKASNLYFPYNSFALIMDDQLRDYIAKTIQYLKQQPDKKLLLTGYTDSYGNPEANKILAQQRADVVKQYFIEFGLDSKQIQTDSQGQLNPIAPNNTNEGRKKNRRVEISFK